MRSALLRGRDHTRLGMTAAVAEGRAAIALSRGGAPKSYRHRDPNEDAALVRRGRGRNPAGRRRRPRRLRRGRGRARSAARELRARLDGRSGARAARRAGRRRPRTCSRELNAAILERVARGGPDTARTTLALALLRPGDDLLAFASFGDSHVFQLTAGEVLELGHEDGRRTYYLGFASETADSLAGKYVAGAQSLAGTRAIVLVTDGLSERGIGVAVPEDAVAECAGAAARGLPELRPLGAARGIVERALAEHRRHRAGDNVAAAVAWP